jgi:hypothetical protein
MAINRFSVEKYATIELNNVNFGRSGRVLAQLPLDDAFTESAPCENGMWLVYDERVGDVHKPAAVTDTVGLVYSTEKLYDPREYGLNNFCQIAGQYPRVGMFAAGDSYTTNCFCYDTTEFADADAVETALEALGTTALYLIPSTTGAPQLTATVGTATTVAEVVKYYTMPNGEAGIKVRILKAA